MNRHNYSFMLWLFGIAAIVALGVIFDVAVVAVAWHFIAKFW